MNELITASLVEKDLSRLIEFPTDVMGKFEREVVEWILQYSRKHKEVPDPDRVSREFPTFVPMTWGPKGRLPLSDIFETSLKRRILSFSTNVLADAQMHMREKGELPMELIEEWLQTVVTSSGLDKFSTFDRNLYFRSSGIPLGLRLIDNATGGLSKGDLALIAGRLGVGKTTLAQWITYLWWQGGKKILYVSNEMLSADIFSKIDAMVAKFNPLLFRTKAPKELEGELSRVIEIAGGMESEIVIPRKRLSTPNQIGAIAKYLDIDAIIVDGMYLMQPDFGTFSSKWERVATVSNQIKQLALDLRMPILGIVQIKRVGEKEMFDPEDIAYSDALGQDADFVMALKPDALNDGTLEVQLIKNRYGPNISTIVTIDFDNMQITDESLLSKHIEPRADGRLW